MRYLQRRAQPQATFKLLFSSLYYAAFPEVPPLAGNRQEDYGDYIIDFGDSSAQPRYESSGRGDDAGLPSTLADPGTSRCMNCTARACLPVGCRQIFADEPKILDSNCV